MVFTIHLSTIVCSNMLSNLSFFKHNNVHVPNLVTFLNHASTFEWWVVWHDPRTDTENIFIKKDWTMCSNNISHFRLNNQHD